MTIFTASRQSYTRQEYQIVRAFRKEEDRARWLLKVAKWLEEINGCPTQAISETNPLGYRLEEVDLV